MANSPAHYLKQYHPTVGEPRMIERKMKALKLSRRQSLYTEIKQWDNPEHPRLWPWIYRSQRENPPHSFVRNPYFFGVDPDGNQLPYLDRLLFVHRSSDMAAVAVSAWGSDHGRISYHVRGLHPTDVATEGQWI